MGASAASKPGRRICLFIGALNTGGAERVMAWLARRLAEDGDEVTLITLETPANDRIAVDGAVRRHGLDLFGGHHPLAKPFANLGRVLALRRALARFEADTLVAFMTHESVLAVLATLGTGRRVVISERTAPWRKSPGRVWDALRRRFYRFADVQVAQTEPIAQWLRTRAGCRAVRVIPNAVQYPLPSHPPRVSPDALRRPRRKLLLAVGTKPYQKGFDLLIEAFGAVAGEHPDWHLAFLGLRADRAERGLSGAAIMRRARDLGLEARTLFVDHVGNVGDWYAAADLFVLPSRFEGFPNALIEAMSHGCASIAMDCETGPRDIVEDGVNGLLVTEFSSQALAAALSRCMSDPALRQALAAEAVRVREAFGEEAVFRRWRAALALPGEDAEG